MYLHVIVLIHVHVYTPCAEIIHLCLSGSDGAANEGNNPHLLVLILTMLQCQLMQCTGGVR